MGNVTLPGGWEPMDKGVREFRGVEVLRAVFISNGLLLSVYTNGQPCGKGIPTEVLYYLLERED